MAKLMDLWAETGADIIDDDAQPTLKITNSSTGAALEVNKLLVTSGATILASSLIVSASTITANKLTVNTPILAAKATITGFHMRGASVASGAMMAFTGDALVSCTTIRFTDGGVAGTKAIRIVQSDGTFAWIPVLPDAAVTGAVI